MAKRYLHGLAQAEAATFAAMAAVVEDGCEQQFQHFISNAPWRHEPVIDQIGRDADRLLGGPSRTARCSSTRAASSSRATARRGAAVLWPTRQGGKL